MIQPIILKSTEAEEATGGAGSPELARMTPNGRLYVDPLPWDNLLGALGITPEQFQHGAEFSSVTTLLNYLPKDRLLKWSNKKVAECAAADPWVLEMFGEEAAIQWYSEAGNRERDAAGERGTLIHDVAENGHTILQEAASLLLEGKDIPQRFLDNMNVVAYVKGLQKFFAAYPGIRPIWVEVTVFSRRYGYAGTLDLIAFVPGLGIILLDWKASRYILSKFSFQGAAYAWADYGIVDGVRVPIPPIEGFYVVHIMPGEDDDGAFEVVPLEWQLELVSEIMPAMRSIKRLDHPSRIGKPIERINLLDVKAVAPKLEIVTPAEASALITASAIDDEGLLALCLTPEDRIATDRQVMRDWQIDYCKDVAKALGADESPLAKRMMNNLSTWLSSKAIPNFSSPEVKDPSKWIKVMEELVEGLATAERECGLPFGTPEPADIDFEDLLIQYRGEHHAAIATGLIVKAEDGSYGAAVTRPRLERNMVTLARRGRSVDPDDWSQPRDPAAVERESKLIESARGLPSDLAKELEEWAFRVGVPNLLIGTASDDQLDVLEVHLAELWDHFRQRTQPMRMMLDHFSDDPEVFAAMQSKLLETVECDSPSQLTGDQVVIIEAILTACKSEMIELCDIDGTLNWSRKANEATVLEKFATKAAFLKAGRAASEEYKLPKPKSSADLLETPVLLALTVKETA